MGIYLNPGADMFRQAINSEIYVDKTELLAYTNKVFGTERKYICVSRPRRFGKSMAANMVSAYYDRTADTDMFFGGLKISHHADYDKYRSKCDVIKVNIQDFLSGAKDMDDLMARLTKRLLYDISKAYPDIEYFDKTNLTETMSDVYENTKCSFVIVIDEWDSLFREYRDRKDWQDKYLDFLRDWLKDRPYVGLVYMTGILPIKKYGTHSALNMFREFSMTNPRELAEYVGFTTEEVRALCNDFQRNFDDCRTWYDGYRFADVGEVYNPHAVVEAVLSGIFDTYWNQTETFEALKIYIELDIDGLREKIIRLMAGETIVVNTVYFANDMVTFRDTDDVLTLLIHLGYLGYDISTKRVFIPNNEIRTEFANAIRGGGWDVLVKAVKSSEELLQATLSQNTETVAKGIEAAHIETSHLQYNDENALSYTISLAYYTARQKYLVIREFPTGKGFADLVFLPRPQYMGKIPALIVELKWDTSATTAIVQIKQKNYPQAIADYVGEMLLVGVSYDKGTKEHSCEIEKITK